MSGRLPSAHVAVLTPSGRGAIATLLVEGRQAAAAVDKLFVPAGGRSFRERPCGQIVFGRWERAGGEEIVVCQTAPQQIEIHCHGGQAAADAIADRLAEEGVERIGWQSWQRLNRSDPIVAEAAVATAAAQTERTALILLDQYHGALGREIDAIGTAAADGNGPQALAIIDRLIKYSPIGRHLVQPWSVVLAGRPNVGKSSLINALVGYARAIVFERSGTTRDVVTATTAIDGWPVELADTAGLRIGGDTIESEGIQRAHERLGSADLVLLVCDARAAIAADELKMVAACDSVIWVRNKVDLVAIPPVDGSHGTVFGNVVETSATNLVGIAELIESIARQLAPTPPPTGAAVPFTAPQISSLAQIRESIVRQDLSATQTLLETPVWRSAEADDAKLASQRPTDAAKANG